MSAEAGPPDQVLVALVDAAAKITSAHYRTCTGEGSAMVACEECRRVAEATREALATVLPSYAATVVQEQQAEQAAGRRELAHLVALLAALFPATLSGDVVSGALVDLFTPVGHMSWPVEAADVDLFGHVPRVDWPTVDPTWQSTKFARLAELTALAAAEHDRPPSPRRPVRPPALAQDAEALGPGGERRW